MFRRLHRANRRVSVAYAPTPNDLFIGGTRACVGWWISNNGALPYGSVTLDEASIGLPPTWATNDMSITGGQPDPKGGNAAYTLTETTDGGPRVHYSTATKTTCISSWQEVRFWGKAINRDWLCVYTDGVGGTGKSWVNTSTGAIGTTAAGVTLVKLQTVGDWHEFSYIRNETITTTMRVLLADGDNSYVYTGDGRDNCYIYDVRLIQPRLALMTDESLTALGAARNAHLTQGVDANQPLFYAGFGAIDGKPACYSESGRASNMSSTHVDVAAVSGGVSPGFALIGVMQGAGNQTRCPWWLGAGGEYDIPFSITGSELISYRYDGTSTSQKTIGTGLAASLSTPKTYSFIRKTDRTCSLWLGGVEYNIIHDVLLSSAFTTLYSGGSSTGIDAKFAEGALFSDLSSLGSHAAIYAALRPSLQAMGARWGGLAT